MKKILLSFFSFLLISLMSLAFTQDIQAFSCSSNSPNNISGKAGRVFTISLADCVKEAGDPDYGSYQVVIFDPDGNEWDKFGPPVTANSITFDVGGLTINGDWTVEVYWGASTSYFGNQRIYSATIEITDGLDESPVNDSGQATAICGQPCGSRCDICPTFCPADSVPDPNTPGAFVDACVGTVFGAQLCSTINGEEGFPTAIGCLRFDIIPFIGQISEFLFGISGMIALIMLAISAYKYMTSQGNPDKLQDARDTFFAVIGAVLLMALATLVMRFIGVQLFGLF